MWKILGLRAQLSFVAPGWWKPGTSSSEAGPCPGRPQLVDGHVMTAITEISKMIVALRFSILGMGMGTPQPQSLPGKANALQARVAQLEAALEGFPAATSPKLSTGPSRMGRRSGGGPVLLARYDSLLHDSRMWDFWKKRLEKNREKGELEVAWSSHRWTISWRKGAKSGFISNM